MAISDADTKLLWGRAAGICSNPSCRNDLTVILDNDKNYNVGEMAHVIARKPDGPRGQPGGGADSYANLILLCPTCHRHIDKAPEGEFPEELLKKWKSDHEASIRSVGTDQVFEETSQLKEYVTRRLLENGSIFDAFGPKSEAAKDQGSNLYQIWNYRKLDTILPNNRKIINSVEANSKLISAEEYADFLAFKNHAVAFERNQFNRLDRYPLFPQSFATRFRP